MDESERLVMVLLEQWRRMEAAHDEMAVLIETLANRFNVSAPPAPIEDR